MSANPELVRLCKIWERVAEELNKMGLYWKDDYEIMICRVMGDKAEVVIRDEYDEMSIVDCAKRELEWSDFEFEEANKVIKRIVEERAGGTCEYAMVGDAIIGVDCRDIKDMEKLFMILACSTSMVHRMGVPRKFYGRRLEKIDPECRVEDPIEREICVINKLLDKFERELKGS